MRLHEGIAGSGDGDLIQQAEISVVGTSFADLRRGSEHRQKDD